MDLLERRDDLATLVALLDRARGGRGGLALVRGESGAGKSSLLAAFTDGLDGVPVLTAACDPLTTPRPLGPFHDLAPQLGDEVADVLREASQPHEIFAAVAERLRREPCVLVVDDLHWADQGTVDLLRFLLRRIRVTSSLVVGALRDDEVGAGHPLRALLGDVARSPDAVASTLEPLSEEAVAELVGHRPVDPAWLHRLTGGNAFYVVEMLDHRDAEIPRTVRDAILARTDGLDGDAWELLHLLVCAPGAIPDHLLAPLGIGLPALDAVARAGLLRRGPRGVAFRHDLCRLAVAGTFPPGGEALYHRRMLDALDAAPSADPAVLAHHAVGADDADRTLRHATEAGRAAARSGAHTQAAAFFSRALDQGRPTSPEQEAELLERLAGECYLTDRLEDAIAASERAMRLRERLGDAAGVSANHHALSVYRWYNADRALAEEHADAAEAVLVGAEAPGPTARWAPGARLGHACAMQGFLALHANDTERARPLIARAAQAAETADDPTLTVRAELLDGLCDVLEDVGRGRDATLAILEASHDDFDEVHSSAYSTLTYFDVEQRRLRQAADLLGFTIPLTVERDLPICRVWQLGSRGRLKLIRGEWDAAVADADHVLAGSGAPLARTWPHLVRGLVALRRGQGDADADADLDEAWRLAVRYGEPIRLLPAAAALVERAWLRGVADPRLDECREVLAAASGAGLEWGRGELAIWLRRLDGDSDAESGPDPAGGAHPGGAAPSTGPVAEPYRLQLAGDLEAAAARWAALSAPYEQALVLVELGTESSTRTGLDLLDRLGADDVAAKVRRDLRRRGATAVPSRRREAARTNPAGLTARQVEILHLLVDGSTNAEIADRLYLSPKTVDHHVSALLSKLQVASRREAVRRGEELGLLG